MSAQEPTVGVVGLRYGRAHIPALQANDAALESARRVGRRESVITGHQIR
jgi:hypothetical protein